MFYGIKSPSLLLGKNVWCTTKADRDHKKRKTILNEMPSYTVAYILFNAMLYFLMSNIIESVNNSFNHKGKWVNELLLESIVTNPYSVPVISFSF